MNEAAEQRRIRAAEAKQFMANPLFRAMFDGVSSALEAKELACDTTKEKMAADVIRCKQLLQAMRREIERRVEDGEFASFELEQLEKKRLLNLRVLRR